jgi:hypothetical protein
MEAESVFREFLGEEVKVPYKDGNQFKIARGILESCEGGFIKITGRLGTLIINEKNVERMSLVTNSNQAK